MGEKEIAGDGQTQKKFELSGYAVALGFIGTGLLLYRWYPDGFGEVTGWVASGLMLIGGAGIMVELDGSKWNDLDFTSAGVGALLVLPSIAVSRAVYRSWTGPALWTVMAVCSVFWIIGIAAAANTALDIISKLGRADAEVRIGARLLDFVKQVALFFTAIASIVVAVRGLFEG